MTTELIFRDDAYARDCDARILDVNDRGGIILDRTVFYATSGGQTGDAGDLVLADGETIPIAVSVYGEDRTQIIHVPADDIRRPEAGTPVKASLNWPQRYSMMRMHTALHLLCSILPYPVTGGQIKPDSGRLDFDIPDASLADRQELTGQLNALIEANFPVRERWITDEELAAQPDLVRTMAVQPPTGSGSVRLIEIGDGEIDLQPCGGTHVAATGEIGPVAVSKIEKKGAKNRRIRVVFNEDR